MKVNLPDATHFLMTCDNFLGGFWGEKIAKIEQNLKNIAYLEPCQTSMMRRFVKIVTVSCRESFSQNTSP